MRGVFFSSPLRSKGQALALTAAWALALSSFVQVLPLERAASDLLCVSDGSADGGDETASGGPCHAPLPARAVAALGHRARALRQVAARQRRIRPPARRALHQIRPGRAPP